MILVDTSVWVDFLRGADSTQRRALHRLIEDEEDIAITEIILTEILQGIREDKNFRAVREYLLEFPVLKPKGIETYIKAAEIYRDCRKKGKTVRKTVDCIIAAVCMENDAALLHKDSDFELIEKCAGLKVMDI
ncbi:MAG: PIN domain nuclease [bacterium]